MAFDTADGWVRNVTADIARKLRVRGAGGCVRSGEPTPMATLSYGGIFGDNSGRRLKGTARPHAPFGDEPSLVRDGLSVA
jgi:hypothetical protein